MAEQGESLTREWPQEVAGGELPCLNSWPEGSRGHLAEAMMLTVLNELCRSYGYGRVAQAMADLERLWLDQGMAAHFRERRKLHLADMEAARKVMAARDRRAGVKGA